LRAPIANKEDEKKRESNQGGCCSAIASSRVLETEYPQLHFIAWSELSAGLYRASSKSGMAAQLQRHVFVVVRLSKLDSFQR
jgi:hypothetical protein